VVGIDLSTRVIEVANKMKENRKFEFECKVEGEVTHRLAAALDESIDTSRATFVTVSSSQPLHCLLPACLPCLPRCLP
jgi:hypothetical protein